MTAAPKPRPTGERDRDAKREFTALKFRLFEAACADRRLKNSSAVEVLVIYVIWDRGSEPGKVFRTTEDMHRDTGLSFDAINNARKALIAAGYLVKAGKTAAGGVLYRINYSLADGILEQRDELRRSQHFGEAAYDEMSAEFREAEADSQRRKWRKAWRETQRDFGQGAPGENAFRNQERVFPDSENGLSGFQKGAFRNSESSTLDSGNNTFDIPSKHPLKYPEGIPCADDIDDDQTGRFHQGLEDESAEEELESLQGVSDYAKASRGW